MSSSSKALFFIPDISGFTRFVNETEINHSTHIISELLEVIINNNNIGLEVAEIEGDAIFFYKLNPEVTLDEIIDQCKSMFIAFHKHLRKYDLDRICQCGACISASNLTLKFVTHYGEVLVQKIASHTKLMGKDVTYAHKLMKNDVPDNQYILISSSLSNAGNGISISAQQWFIPIEMSSNYADLGNIDYQYGSLATLLSEIPEPPKRDKSHFVSDNPIRTSITINSPILDVHAKLIDMSIRPLWRTKIGKVSDKVERLGTIHECLLPTGGGMDVKVIDNIVEGDKIVYKEHAEGAGFLGPKGTEEITLTKIDNNSCHLDSLIHQEISPLHKFIIRPLLITALNSGFKKFKVICES